MSLSPREWSTRAGKKAMSYTSDIGNLEMSWRVGISQTQTWESLSDQCAKNFPSDEYPSESFLQIWFRNIVHLGIESQSRQYQYRINGSSVEIRTGRVTNRWWVSSNYTIIYLCLHHVTYLPTIYWSHQLHRAGVHEILIPISSSPSSVPATTR